MRHLVFTVVLISVPAALFARQGSRPHTATTAQRSRAAVLKDYKENYVGTTFYNMGWTGDAATCNPGTLPKTSYDFIIRRINFFRRMAGFTRPCTLDSMLSPMLQQTALMMHANSRLNHFPDSTWKCYTKAAVAGAGSSNLHLGSTSTSAIEGFMEDGGSANAGAGHRRWILQPSAGSFGFGATSKVAALHVFGKPVKQPVPPFIAWPPPGFVPRPIVYERWSFSIASATYDQAQVSMQGPEGEVPLNIVATTGRYGDPCLVWEPKGIQRHSDSDAVYTVTIRGIKGTKDSVYRYKVIIIKPD
jgi:hypothetical protein